MRTHKFDFIILLAGLLLVWEVLPKANISNVSKLQAWNNGTIGEPCQPNLSIKK